MNISELPLRCNTQRESSYAVNQLKRTSVCSSASEMLMEELKKQYQNIKFDFVDFASEEQMKQYASSKYGNNHVAISPKLLEKMASDETIRIRVEGILDSFSRYQNIVLTEKYSKDKRLAGMGLVLDENGGVSKWTAMEELSQENLFSTNSSSSQNESLFTSERKKKEFYDIPYKYSQSHHMMRLANAKNVASVRGLIASSYNEIGKVKLKVSDPKEAVAIIRKIKKVIQSGNIKIARLHKEDRIFREERLAAKKQKIKLQQQLEEQLRKKRIARKAQEHCQTASFDDIFVKPSIQDERYRQISQQYGVNCMDMGFTPVSVTPSGAQASFVSVQISEVSVSIDCSV